ncbi:MAG: glycosyltransferase family 2 protein [Candidatus Ancillula sp.]|nr:glycosyltransferase family 2 protein [Candidatus Ancillula sp.]
MTLADDEHRGLICYTTGIDTKLISILIPAYNEEESLSMLFDRLWELSHSTTPGAAHENYRLEFVFVDDGSTDNTVPMIRDFTAAADGFDVRYFSLSRNFGKEIAMAAALDKAQGDAVLFIDADLQDPPELVWEMLKYWEHGFDDVYARRSSRKGETWLKKTTSKLYYRLLQSVAKVEIQIDTGDFRLLDRKCVDAMKLIHEEERNTKALFSWIGYNKKEILYKRDERSAGKTKWNYFKLISLAINGITSYTTSPLRLATILGVVFSFASFVYIVYILIKNIFFGIDLHGYPSTMAVILFFGGVQLLVLGVIGEYVGKIFIETKNRPLYLIKEEG